MILALWIAIMSMALFNDGIISNVELPVHAKVILVFVSLVALLVSDVKYVKLLDRVKELERKEK